MIVKRGEIYECDLGSGVGNEQGGKRPVLILQNNTGNQYSGTTIVAPLTTVSKRDWLPTHVDVMVYVESVAMLEQIRIIDKCRLNKKICECSVSEMYEIDKAVKISLGV